MGDVVGPVFLALMLVVPAAASHAFFVEGARVPAPVRGVARFVGLRLVRGVAWFVVRVEPRARTEAQLAARPDVAPPAPSRPPPWTKAAERPPEPRSGHRRAATAAESQEAVLAALRRLGRPVLVSELAAAVGCSDDLARLRLRELVEQGRVVRDDHGGRAWQKYSPSVPAPRAAPEPEQVTARRHLHVVV